MADNSNLVDIPEDMTAFKALFENPDAESNPVEDTEDEGLATDEDKDAPEGDEVSEAEESEAESEDEPEETPEEEESEEEEEPEAKEEPKKKKSSYQERLNEITRARREAERQNAILLQRIEALEARERDVTKSEPIKERLPQGAPTPDAVDEKGEPLYPLGAYDPDFITDLAKFTADSEFKALKEKEAAETAARQQAEAQNQLRTEWNSKLDEYEEEVPEIRDHIVDLVDTFRGLDPAYGEYLAVTLMSAENGPQIMDYLSQNIGEAQKIVASGPAAATLAIGRLDAKLSTVSVRPDPEEKRNKKESEAPPPPKAPLRGSKGGGRSVRPDTDNFADFTREFLKP